MEQTSVSTSASDTKPSATMDHYSHPSPTLFSIFDSFENLPNTILGQTCPDHEHCRKHLVKDIEPLLSYYKKDVGGSKLDLLRELITLERSLSQRECHSLGIWLRKKGTLNELAEAVQAAKAEPVHTSSLEAVQDIQNECSICNGLFEADSFPLRNSAAENCCKGLTAVCGNCLARYINIHIRDLPWGEVVCTHCSERLPDFVVSIFASPELFTK